MHAADMDFRFSKSERLRHKRLFESLFKDGSRCFSHPLMVVWKHVEIDQAPPVQVGFSVPKKHCKSAVKRNLIKRRLKEAYRLQKHDLFAASESQGLKLAMLFVVVKTDNISFHELSPKMMLLLREIASKVKDAR